MEEANIYPVISQPKKPLIFQWVGLILFTFFFLCFLGLAIADADWTFFNMTTIGYMIILTSMSLSMFFKKIYYFSTEKIVIADSKNQYLTEMPIYEVEKWNYYSNEKEDCLVVSGKYTSLIIDKHKYRNFEELVNFFANSDLVRDSNFKSSGIKNEAIPEVFIHAFYYSLSIAITLNFLFWIITYSKRDSTEIQYFQGHIQAIETFRKSSSVRMALEEYTSFTFKFDREGVRKYSLANKADLIGKKVKIGILKSDYEWKIKNKTIRMLDLNSIPYLNAVSLEQTGQLQVSE